MKAFLVSSSHGILDTQANISEQVVFSIESRQKCHSVTQHEMEELLTYHVKTPATSNKTMSKQKGCVDTRKIINKKNNQQREAKGEKSTKET